MQAVELVANARFEHGRSGSNGSERLRATATEVRSACLGRARRRVPGLRGALSQLEVEFETQGIPGLLGGGVQVKTENARSMDVARLEALALLACLQCLRCLRCLRSREAEGESGAFPVWGRRRRPSSYR